MIILSIETSCDDTAIALLECVGQRCRILSNVVSSQVKIHAPYGGVVPNLAARAHLENLAPCLKEALKQAGRPKIDLIAVTIGPGLIPSLLVGVNFAKALAYLWQKPILGVNHLEGHIYANWLTNSQITFPALCLIVSGGHSQLILMKDHSKYQLLGETRDDAAGEAFDKVAKLLGLGYPGGPAIARYAEQRPASRSNIKFPRPMINSKNYDFSFSGLKTAVLYKVKSLPRLTPRIKSEISYQFQKAVIDVLVSKTIKAARQYQVKTILLSGGVAANQELRRQMTRAIEKEIANTKYQIPDPKLCTDNGAMIGAAAFYKRKPALSKQSWLKIKAQANLKLVA